MFVIVIFMYFRTKYEAAEYNIKQIIVTNNPKIVMFPIFSKNFFRFML